MSKFVTKNIQLVEGKQQFKQLIIVEDKVDAAKLQAEIAQKEINGEEVDIKGVIDIKGFAKVDNFIKVNSLVDIKSFVK